MVVQTSFLVLKCIVCTKYPVKLNSWLYYIATYIFMYCDFFLMSFWQTCLLLSHSPLPHPTKPTPVGLCVVVLGEGGIEKKKRKKSQSDITQQRWRPSVPTRWNSVWCRSKWAEEVQRWTAFQPCCFCFFVFFLVCCISKDAVIWQWWTHFVSIKSNFTSYCCIIIIFFFYRYGLDIHKNTCTNMHIYVCVCACVFVGCAKIKLKEKQKKH